MVPKFKSSRPPNFAQIVAVFPMARAPTVIFAYAPNIYVPSGKEIPPALVAHETVHIERQQKIGVELWWEKYLADPQFRFDEELLAHRAEFRATRTLTHRQEEVALKIIAKKLAAPLYGRMVKTEEAMRLIAQP